MYKSDKSNKRNKSDKSMDITEYFSNLSKHDLSNISEITIKKLSKTSHLMRSWLLNNINQMIIIAMLKNHRDILLSLLWVLDEKNLKEFSEREIVNGFKNICDCLIVIRDTYKTNMNLQDIQIYKKMIEKEIWKSYLSD